MKYVHTTIEGDGCEHRVRLYDDGELRIVEVNGQDVDEVSGIDARALFLFLQESLPCSSR